MINRMAALTLLYCMLRNRASGPAIGLPGRIWAGLLSGKHRNRPGRPISGPEALLRNIEYGCQPVRQQFVLCVID